MKRFTDLYLALDATNASSEKRALLADYFRTTPDNDAAVALFFLAGERLHRTASTPLLKQTTLETTRYPEWLLKECRAAVGDFAETVALLHDNADTPAADEPLHRTFAERLKPFELADDDERKRLLAAAMRELDADQRFVFLKLIRGGFRVGVQRTTVANALADLTNLDTALIAQRLANHLEPTAAAFRAVTAPPSEDDNAATPAPFCLANPLDVPPAPNPTTADHAASAERQLGNRADYTAEWKYDGIRAQLVHNPPAPTLLWSRGEEIISLQFPELTAAAKDLPTPAILDGEILLTDPDAKPLPFAHLQTRLNRKPASLAQPSLFETARPAFIAYDILRLGDTDLRDRTTTQRRTHLEHLLAHLPTDHPIRLSPTVTGDTWLDLATLRATSRERAVEGLMLKHVNAPYHPGRTRTGPTWWKWKVDPLTADAVLVYAQVGSGRRAALFTDYTFALWSDHPADPNRTLVPFAKAYSGLSNDEIERVDRFVRKNTTDTMGPVRRVNPELVFEIAYEAVRLSDRHASGLAVRFPRILRPRPDKKPADADTLHHLRAQLPHHPD